MPKKQAQTAARSGRVLAVSLLVWGAGVVVGLASLWGYASGAGDLGQGPAAWPAASSLALDSEGPTALLFAHPRCPCTRASLHELDKLMLEVQASATVVFWQPADANSDWRTSELIRFAEESPRLTAVIDHDGRETDLFDARTSGLCLVYAPDSALCFRGGVTAGRGHEGPTHTQQVVAELYSHPGPSVHGRRQEFPVFGCSIRGD